ncbi:O-antigen ligase family protein [Flavobacterium sp. LHD-85]|uniref:O-antigen ligase family protein n=1 Tax=Flavobacterium sp. LHD-85 TaxID=3071410 RepID=UPI0027E104DB|nr:O-antigen ligase family protein [Flavobacterium sp. LHD-85]MDQ6528583.1 O-antigen ligase family protein [Flavobacterium sp. LHD-85]
MNFSKKLIKPILYLLVGSSLIYFIEAFQSIMMIVTALLLISFTTFEDFKISKKNAPFLLSFFILAFYYTLFFSSKSLKLIAESLLLFVIPLLSIYLYQLETFTKDLKKIQFAYSISLSLLCLYFLVFYIYDIPNHHFDWYLARYNLEFYNKIHGTYICLWIAIAILFLADLTSGFKQFSLPKKVLFSVMFALLFSGLIIYNSRNIIVGLIIISSIRFLLLKKRNKTISKKLLFLVLFAVITVILLSQRYLEDIQFLFENSFKNSTRYAAWSCSAQLIYDSNFLGMDFNLIQEKLNECYVPFHSLELTKFKINSHNQYLDFLLKGGILMLLAFISILFVKVKYALKSHNYLYLSVTILFVISFITENILVRQYGIYSYFLCDVLFLGSILGNKNHSRYEVKKY